MADIYDHIGEDLGKSTSYAYYVAEGGTKTPKEYGEMLVNIDTVATRAEDAADAAAESATGALNSKNAAQTAATTATNKASEATTAAQTATTKAGEASQSASQASGSAQTASNKASEASASASTATAKATEATTAAETATGAATTATTAKDDAVSAKAEAETAQGKAETAQGAAEDAADRAEAALALKADAIGNYPDLAVGTAEQIDSDTVVSEDVAPYQFRQSISGASNRAYDKIVGGSLAVNQLVLNGNFSEMTGWSGVNTTFTISENVATITINDPGAHARYLRNTCGGVYSVVGHKYLSCFNAISVSGTARVTSRFGATNNATVLLDNTWKQFADILNATGSYAEWNVYISSGSDSDAVLSVKNCVCFDLTQMFGSTIADYVYGLETATAGAGVAWLKAHFPRIFNAGYIPYNAGELVSVQASAHKMTGFNQWDEEWERTSINWNTRMFTPSASGGRLSPKNYIPVLPNTTYYINKYVDNYMAGYDNDNPTNGYNIVIDAGRFTTPSNCHFIKFGLLTDNYGKTYKNDICINISSSRNGEYEPYEAHSYPLDDSLELRGLPKLDADNNLVYDGDVYESTGKVARKYGIVDLGTLTWEVASGIFRTNVPNFASPADYTSRKAGFVCQKYPADTQISISESAMTDKTALRLAGGLYIKDTSYVDSSSFKTAMSGVYLVYELATPTTETAQPFTNPQVVDASGTEEYVTDSVVPVGHVTKYVENLKAKLESAPASPTEDGDYIVRQTDGVNEYVPLEDAPILDTKADVTDLLKAFPTDSAQGAIASFSDGAELPIKSLTVDIEPIQDLHGYDNPWPAWGGKNKINAPDVTLDSAGYIYNGSVDLPAGTYTMSLVWSGSGTPSASFAILDADGNSVVDGSHNFPYTFTISVDAVSAKFYVAAVGTYSKIQIEAGSTATAYAPYSNICPISGHTQAVVTRTGVNVWDEEWEVGDISTSSGQNTDASEKIRSKNYTLIKKGASYTIVKPSGSGTIYILYYGGNKNYLSFESIGSSASYYNLTIPTDAEYVRIKFTSTYGTTYNHDISINYPSTDHDYHPYSGQSINIPLGQTVYGGTLDVLSGELVIDRAMVDLGDLTWTYSTNKVIFTSTAITTVVGRGTNIVCSMYKTTDNVRESALGSLDKVIGCNKSPTLTTGNFAYGTIIVKDTAYTDANTFKTAVTGQTLVYELATPITVTLTPNELSTLLGANNIWSDAGEVTAEYRADPTLFIQRKIAEALS